MTFAGRKFLFIFFVLFHLASCRSVAHQDSSLENVRGGESGEYVHYWSPANNQDIVCRMSCMGSLPEVEITPNDMFEHCAEKKTLRSTKISTLEQAGIQQPVIDAIRDSSKVLGVDFQTSEKLVDAFDLSKNYSEYGLVDLSPRSADPACVDVEPSQEKITTMSALLIQLHAEYKESGVIWMPIERKRLVEGNFISIDRSYFRDTSFRIERHNFTFTEVTDGVFARKGVRYVVSASYLGSASPDVYTQKDFQFDHQGNLLGRKLYRPEMPDEVPYYHGYSNAGQEEKQPSQARVYYGGGVGSACFLSGTMIWTPNGQTKIESLSVGDRVYSYDTKNEKIVTATVEKIFRHSNKDWGTLVTSSNHMLELTAEHPIYSKDKKRWIEAFDLDESDHLLTINFEEELEPGLVEFQPATVESTFSPKGKADVYNIRVSQTRNYFANGVLVHNK